VFFLSYKARTHTRDVQQEVLELSFDLAIIRCLANSFRTGEDQIVRLVPAFSFAIFKQVLNVRDWWLTRRPYRGWICVRFQC